jgi:UDP-glucose 4-epimerase
MTKPFSERPSILLVGATGRVGRLLCHHWPADPNRPQLLPVRRRAEAGTSDGLVWSPLEGPQALLWNPTHPPPVALVMMAGVTPGPAVDDAALAVNRTLAEACLDAARQAGIGRVLLASSAAVYGLHPDGLALDETAPTAPISAYGRAKLDMEAAAAPARDAGLNVTLLRIGNVAGADALLGPLTGLHPDEHPPLRIDAFADGLGPLRSYIGAASLARVLARLSCLPGPGPDVLNIAAPDPVRMTALAEAAGWPFLFTPAPDGARQAVTLDCRRLHAICPEPPSENLPEIMVQNWKESWR